MRRFGAGFAYSGSSFMSNFHPRAQAPSPFRKPGSLRRIPRLFRQVSGIALLEVMVSMGLVMLISVTATSSILTINRISARNRVLTAARAVVQRNIDNTLSLTWDSSVEPAVLGITAASGVAYDDDAGGTTGMVNLMIQKNGNSQVILLQGNLMRIVTAVTNSEGADIRRITFRLTYNYQKVDYVVEMTTMRTIDD